MLVRVAITPHGRYGERRVPSSTTDAPAHSGETGIEAKDAKIALGAWKFVRFMFLGWPERDPVLDRL